MTTLTLQKMKCVLKHVDDLATLVNVDEERKWLEQFLSSDDVEECIKSGKTNLERMEALCIKLVASKSLELFNGLCGLLMERQKRFLHVYNVLTNGQHDSDHSDHSEIRSTSSISLGKKGNASKPDSFTLFQLQTKIKEIEEELQLWRSTALNKTINTAKQESNPVLNPIFYAKSFPQEGQRSLFHPYTRKMVKLLERNNYRDWKFRIDNDEDDAYDLKWKPKLRVWKTMVEVVRVGMDLGMWYSLMLPAKTGNHIFVVRLLMYSSHMDVYTWHHTNALHLEDDVSIELSYSLKLEVPLFEENEATKKKTWTFEKDGKMKLEFFETLCLTINDIPWEKFSDEEIPSLSIQLTE